MVAPHPIVDHVGRQAFNSIFGDQITAGRTPDILVQFQYGISNNDVSSTLSGTGAATNGNATATLSTGSGVGEATLVSKDIIRYQPGFDCYCYFTAAFSATTDADTYQRIGPHDDANGFAVGQIGGKFALIRFHEGEADDVIYPDLSKFTWSEFDPTMMNIYRVNFGWLGVAPDIFEVYAGVNLGWKTLGYFEVLNVQVGPSIVQPVQPISAEVYRGSGAGAVTLASCSWSAGRIGMGFNTELPSNRQFGGDVAKTISGGVETNLITIRNKTIFQGRTNRVVAHMNNVSGGVDGTKNTILRLRVGATVGGTPSWVDVDAANSVMEYDVSGTTVSGGRVAWSAVISKVGSASQELRFFHIRLRPGEWASVTAESISGTDTLASLLWLEEF